MVRAREAALRRQAQILERHVLRRLIDAPLEIVLRFERRYLGRDEAKHHLLSARYEPQRLEAAGALGVELHKEGVDAGGEHRLGHRLVAALGDPSALEIAAGRVHRDGEARGLALYDLADRACIALRQRRRVVTIPAAGVADLRIAEVGERDIVQLQIAAAGLRKRRNGCAVGGGRVGPELLHVVIGDAGAAGAQMQHRRRRDGELRRALRGALQEAEGIDHDRLAVAQFADDGRDGRLLLGAAELRSRVLAQLDAVELRQEVQVPPLAAEFAVADALQADGLLPRYHLADGALALGAPVRWTQQAADVVGTKGRRQSALAPDSRTALDHLVTSVRRKAANSPAVFAFHSRPSCASFSCTSAAESARLISELSRFTSSEDMPAGAKNAVQVRSSKPEKPCSFTLGTSGSAGERCALVTAMARTRPAFTCAPAGRMGGLRNCLLPAPAAPTACAG